MKELLHKCHQFVSYDPSIHDLRKLGWKVRVIHGEINNTYPQEFLELGHLAHKFTRIELRSPEGIEYVGVSYCSKKDNYNRKIGNKIALGRALKAAMLEIKINNENTRRNTTST
jgi:hypothetical protein